MDNSTYTGPVTGPRYLTEEETRHYLASTLNYTLSETCNAVTGALAVEGGVYRSLAAHDVSYVIEGGKHLGYVITPKPAQPALTRPQVIIANAPQELDYLMHAVEMVDAWLDGTVAEAYKDQPLAQDWARVCKETEERGESVAELILATGQNPRKGTDPDARDRLLDELADRAVTSLFAIQHFTKDIGLTWDGFMRAIAKAHNRAAAAGYK